VGNLFKKLNLQLAFKNENQYFKSFNEAHVFYMRSLWREAMISQFKKIFSTLLIAILPSILISQTENQKTFIGYKDENRDGFNDLFRDANGDGINDVTNQPYTHSFSVEDKNKDDLNDIWIDRDGDGVNDLMFDLLKKRGVKAETPWIDKNGDGIQDEDIKPKFNASLTEYVLDTDKDGKNDITGIEFTSENAMGYRFGKIDEDRSKEIKKFDDKDKDGMDDRFVNRFRHDLEERVQGRAYDYFIDRDGDGISDGRGFDKIGKQHKGSGHGKKNSP
jgi:hypothetical protein